MLAGDVCECSDALSVRDPSPQINVLSSADSDFLIRDYLLVSWFPSKFCRKSQRLIDIVAEITLVIIFGQIVLFIAMVKWLDIWVTGINFIIANVDWD